MLDPKTLNEFYYDDCPDCNPVLLEFLNLFERIKRFRDGAR